MADPTQQTTALAIPEKATVIALIVAKLKRTAAGMLPKYTGTGKNKKRLSDERRMEMIEKHLVMSPTSAGMPFITSVSFGGERKRVGSKLVQVVKDGKPQFNEEGNPVVDWTQDEDIAIVGKAELPDPKDGNKRVSRDVEPLILCNHRGGLVPYVSVNSQGQLGAGPSMHCFFIRDFNPETGKENGKIRAVPLGLGEKADIARYNEIVRLRSGQNPQNTWEQIVPIENNIGRAVQFLSLRPAGLAVMQGLVPVWKGWSYSELDSTACDFWIVDRLGGKAAVLDKKSQGNILVDGEVVELYYLIEEIWNSVKLRVWGIPGEVGEMEMRELEQQELVVEWIPLLGGSLYSVTPRSAPTLIRNSLQAPPTQDMIALGLLPMGATDELAREVIRSFKLKISSSVEHTVTQALQDLVRNLSPGGLQQLDLSLEDMLGDKPTSELLQQAMDSTEEDLLAAAILDSKTAKDLGLEVWSKTCYVEVEARKAILLNKARSMGLELPLPPDVDDETEAEAEEPANGSNGAPAIVWHEGMNAPELRALAKGIEGVTSKTTKPVLIEKLQGVCPPTPPA